LHATSANATVGNIAADITSDDASDLAMVITADGASGNTATVGTIGNDKGTVTLNLSGAANVTVGAITAADATVSASTATGTLTLNMSSVAAAVSATLGTGTNTYTVGLGNDVITLASLAGTDTIKMNTTNFTTDIYTINNFQAGAGRDKFSISESALDTAGDLIDGNGDAIIAADTVVIEEVSASNLTAEDGDNIFVLTGSVFASAALAQAAIENNGSLEMTFAGNLTANDDFIIVWSDGTDTHISSYVNNTTNAAVNPVAGGTLTEIATLVGVDASVAGTLHADNFAFIA